MAGRKPTIINLVATSPEGEVSHFHTLTDAANELGFHRSTLKRVYDARRNWIEDYTLEWLDVSDKLKKEKTKEKKYRTIAEKVKKEKVESDKRRDERLKLQGKPIVKEVKNKCVYCGRDLSNEDKMNYFALSEMNKKGEALSHKNYKSLNEASNDTGISMGALKNARDKMNDFVIRRKDGVPFQIIYIGQTYTWIASKLGRKTKEKLKDKIDWKENEKKKKRLAK